MQASVSSVLARAVRRCLAPPVLNAVRTQQKSEVVNNPSLSAPPASSARPGEVFTVPTQPPGQPSAARTWIFPAVVGLSIPAAVSMVSGAAGLTPHEWYLSLLEANPFGTKLVTGIVGAFVGDVIAQALPPLTTYLTDMQAGGVQTAGSKLPISYDLLRTARFLLFATVIQTPVIAVWFKFLDLNIMPNDPTSTAAVMTKVALDQLCLAPVMTCVFFSSMALMQGQALRNVPEMLSKKLWPTMKLNYMLWPLAHTFNFALVPTDERILFVNCVAVLWTTILSTMAARK